LVLLLGTVIFAGTGYVLFQPLLEDFIANILYGGSLLKFISVIIFLAVWVLFVLVFSINGKIGNFLTIKNYLAKKKRNPLFLYFVDVWAYFGRYISLIFCSLWYVLWPMAIVWGGIILGERFIVLPSWISLGGTLVGILLLVWRVIRLTFVREMLIQFHSTTKRTFDSALKLSKGNWWGIFISILSFFLLINGVRAIFLIPEMILSVPEWLVLGAQFLDFFFSFFVLAPLLIAFIYFLMIHLLKQKNIKS